LKQFADALGQVVKNPVTRWVTIGGCFRFWETFSIVYYLPAFFQKCFPAFKVEYGLYNAAIVSIMGFISTLAGGLISDRFEK
jgi:nitrate/nitrite transporter NarK